MSQEANVAISSFPTTGLVSLETALRCRGNKGWNQLPRGSLTTLGSLRNPPLGNLASIAKRSVGPSCRESALDRSLGTPETTPGVPFLEDSKAENSPDTSSPLPPQPTCDTSDGLQCASPPALLCRQKEGVRRFPVMPVSSSPIHAHGMSIWDAAPAGHRGLKPAWEWVNGEAGSCRSILRLLMYVSGRRPTWKVHHLHETTGWERLETWRASRRS